MKLAVPLTVIGLLLTVGCSQSRKAEPEPAAPALTEYVPPPAPAPAPEPVYTPAPEPEPIVTAIPPAPDPHPAVKAPVAKPAPAKTPSSRTYVVKKGDTLSGIAKANKTSVKRLMELNPSIKQADKIYVGQKLRLP